MTLSRLLPVISMVLLTLIPAGCEDGRVRAVSPADVAGVTANEIVDNPDDYVGRTITVSGEIEKTYGPHALT